MVLMLIMLGLIGPNLLELDVSVLKFCDRSLCFTARTLFITATTTLLILSCMNFLCAVRCTYFSGSEVFMSWNSNTALYVLIRVYFLSTS